jgi:hypothetical protein
VRLAQIPRSAQPTDTRMNSLDTIFRHLDRWRHFPAYQLERRADIFFSIYLRGIIEEHTGVPLDDEIIPELPLKRDLIWPDLRTDKSVKVDYALFSRDRTKVFFVELKTDGSSRRAAQDDYLAVAKRLGFRPFVDGIRAILLSTSHQQKYFHLVASLVRLGYLTAPADLESFLYPEPRSGLTARLREIALAGPEATVEVIYVQPELAGAESCVDFATFASYVARFDDPISERFSAHLLSWRERAGSLPPAAV